MTDRGKGGFVVVGTPPTPPMSNADANETVTQARVAATSAGALLEGIRGLRIAVADPDHARLENSLCELMPYCRALSMTFPKVRGRVAGLVYEAVEYRGYEGSSALHIVAQIADLLLEAGDRWVGADKLPTPQLERLSAELDRALPGALDDWLRTKLDPELAALERELGATITDLYHQIERPRSLARIERMIQPFTQAPGRVVRAGTASAARSGASKGVSVEFLSEKRAIVTEGGTTVEIGGPRRVWVLKQVVEAQGRTVAWSDLVKADLRRAAEVLEQGGGSRTPRMATNPASFARMGNRIREALGKLAYCWHQNGQGARWSSNGS